MTTATKTTECYHCRKPITYDRLTPDLPEGIFKPQRSTQHMQRSGETVGSLKRFPYNGAAYWEYYCVECRPVAYDI